MQHGRTIKTHPFTGFKRHVLKLVDADLILDAVVRCAKSRSVPRWPASHPRRRQVLSLFPIRLSFWTSTPRA